MPAYDFECPICGRVQERRVAVGESEPQICGSVSEGGEACAGVMARRCHYGSLVISTPMSFRAESSDMPEMTPELRKHWDEMGVHHAGFREI